MKAASRPASDSNVVFHDSQDSSRWALRSGLKDRELPNAAGAYARHLDPRAGGQRLSRWRSGGDNQAPGGDEPLRGPSETAEPSGASHYHGVARPRSLRRVLLDTMTYELHIAESELPDGRGKERHPLGP